MLKSNLRTHTAERRRHSRCTLPIPTQISLNGASHDATLRDISVGGLSLDVMSAIATHEHHAIQLAFSSQIGLLEIRGRIVRARESANGSVTTGTSVAIQFDALGETEELILASLLEGASEQTAALRLTVFLMPEDSGALLLDHVKKSTMDRAPNPREVADEDMNEMPAIDRRLRARVAIGAHASVRLGAQMPVYTGRISDLSVSGACFILDEGT